MLRPLDIDSSYQIIVGDNNTIKIPYDLLLFPGFMLSSIATNTKGDVKITTNGVAVDIDLAPIESGTDEPAVRYVTSKNKTIIINKQSDLLDLGIATKFEYVQETYTLNLYAITYDDNEQEIDTLLSSVELDPGISDITTELSHTEGSTTTYRNLVFTYANGDIKRVSLDYFWNEIRSDLRLAVTNLNQRITSEVGTLNITISNLDTKLTNALNSEQEAREQADTNLGNRITQETTRATNKENEIVNKIGNKTDGVNVDTVYGYVNKNSQELGTRITNEIDRATQKENAIISDLNTHTSDVNNPHQVTKAQVGLGNVANTGDSATPTQNGTQKFTTGGAYTLKQNLETSISNEITRATTKENEISTNLSNETTRATNKENSLETAITNETSARQQDVSNLQSEDTRIETKLDNEITRSTNKDTELTTSITSINNKINVDVHIETNQDEISYNGDTVTKTSYYQNLYTGAQNEKEEVIHLANSTNAGMMSPTDYQQIRNNTSRIENIEGQTTRLIYTDSQNPTQQDIQDFVDDYLTDKGVSPITPEDYTGIAVVVQGTYHIWHYYSNDNIGWRDDGQDTVSQFTNEVAGIIKGSQTDGFVYAESNGTGSVFGWSQLKTRVTNLETGKADAQDLQSEIVDRQNADTTLQTNIDNEALARQSADETLTNNLSQEVSTRTSQVNTLNSNLSDEITNRQNADNVLQGKINSEEQARISADNQLQDNINDETTRAIVSETIIQDDIDNYSFKNITEEYINSLFLNK